MQAITPEERKGMLDVLSKFNSAQSGAPDVTAGQTITESTTTTSNTKEAEMRKILENFNNATNVAVDTHVDSDIATPMPISKNRIQMADYVVETEQGRVGSTKKKYYKIIDHDGNILYENLCLWASASAIIKHLMDDNRHEARQVAQLDADYGSKLFEGANLRGMLKSKDSDVYEAKLSEVKMKATGLKLKILNNI
jgi:hypothetical protein|tara:strand:+ start:282 stop:869 length:588 start_codon:yes stop_codon:yes gene_type:complete